MVRGRRSVRRLCSDDRRMMWKDKSTMQMDVSRYLHELQQNEAIPSASLPQYETLVKALNDTVMHAARDRLQFEDEPARFQYLIESKA
jgi:hypothetical protein